MNKWACSIVKQYLAGLLNGHFESRGFFNWISCRYLCLKLLLSKLMYFKQNCLFNALSSTVLIWQIRMGHLITSKEVVKYFLRAVHLLLVGFCLKIRFPSRKQHKSLSRAVWCLQSQSGSGRYSGFALSHLGVAPGSTELLEFINEVTTWFPVCCIVPNAHLTDRGLKWVYCFLLMPIFLEEYLLIGRGGGSLSSYMSPKIDNYVLWVRSTWENRNTVPQKNNLGAKLNLIPGNDSLHCQLQFAKSRCWI